MNNKALDNQWMKLAIDQAKLAEKIGEVPVGAVLIKDNKLIAKAHNSPIKNNDATAHAEIEVLRKAGNILNNYRLPNTTIFVTLEPCLMCISAITQARIEKIVFGAYDNKGNSSLSFFNLNQQYFNHKVNIVGGMLEKDCQNLLQLFFKNKRNNLK